MNKKKKLIFHCTQPFVETTTIHLYPSYYYYVVDNLVNYNILSKLVFLFMMNRRVGWVVRGPPSGVHGVSLDCVKYNLLSTNKELCEANTGRWYFKDAHQKATLRILHPTTEPFNH